MKSVSNPTPRPACCIFESQKSPTASRGEIKRCGEEHMLELDADIEYTVYS